MLIKDVAAIVSGPDPSLSQIRTFSAFAGSLSAYLVGINLIEGADMLCPYLDVTTRRALSFPEFTAPMSPLRFTTQDLTLSDMIRSCEAEHMLTAYDHLETYFHRSLRPQAVRGEWHTIPYDDHAQAAALARRCDLMLIAGWADLETRTASRGRLIRNLLVLSGRPLLHLPLETQVPTVPRTILVGWDGSDGAHRAVNAALSLLRQAEAVELLVVDGASVETDEAGIVARLRRHGVRVSPVQQRSAGQPIAEVLLTHASRIGADLLVAGAYAHSRAREWAIRSITRDLIRQAPIPTFLSH
jgi:nucleotide-binding universal stress UspA family protein